jgi:hypothetical protein
MKTSPTRAKETPLKEIYSNLSPINQAALRRFVNDNLGKRSPNTLLNWMSGKSQPSQAEKKAITEYVALNIKEITQDDLFPTKS